MAIRVADKKLVERRDAWSSLMRELERPLVPGFMTAGYTALGRFIFLASSHREPSEAHPLPPLLGARKQPFQRLSDAKVVALVG